MLHYPMDAMNRVPLETFNNYIGGALPFEIDREKADSGTMIMGSKRPNYLCWTKQLLLFKGKKKANSGAFQMALGELEEKFNVLDPICSDDKKNSRILSLITSELNANKLVDQIIILRTVVNIARIILTISDNIPSTFMSLEKRQKIMAFFYYVYDNVVEKIISREEFPYADNVG
ncbi:hypothetical protein RclHR1_01100034 [Rhizophagus clarus]|nr:hypothetical protein RclHR1_01100034 [Rhizophagus clarus]